MRYIERVIDKEIQEKLSISGAIVIKGPKWCGKTTSAKQIAKSVLEMQNPDLHENYLELASTKPSLLLEGEKPRLIDEWQLAPKLWNAVRHSVDNTAEPSQYILTGSATPKEDDTLHSGTGRFAFITMKPMTLYESGESNGAVSLSDLLAGKTDIDGKKTDLTYEKIAHALCRGGWPNAIKLSNKSALKIPVNYLELLCESDISKIDGVRRNPTLARAILKSYARHVSTINTDKSLYEDIRANYSEVAERTIFDYIGTLKRLYVIEEIDAWNPNIRSKTSIRSAPKKSMVDPSLAVAALGCTPHELMLDAKTFGLLFENLVNRDLSVYVNSIGGSLKHYRDRFGLECDNTIHFHNGKYALVEVKLGGSRIKEAEEHLLKLRQLVIENEPKLGAPEFLMIITGTDLAYKTENGVLVVPIGCLKH
jgi:predicted AAA+ superfamily ATPase